MAINRLNPDYPDAGLVQLVPTSIAVGSGSGSVNGNGTVDFSGVSTVSLNGVFTSTYTHYLIRTEVRNSTQADIALRLRVSGTDSSANYAQGRYYVGETASIAAGSTNNSTGLSGITTGTYGTERGSFTIQISNPFETQHTSWTVIATGAYFQIIGATHQAATSYDGFSLISDAPNMTGQVSIYGYRK